MVGPAIKDCDVGSELDDDVDEDNDVAVEIGCYSSSLPGFSPRSARSSLLPMYCVRFHDGTTRISCGTAENFGTTGGSAARNSRRERSRTVRPDQRSWRGADGGDLGVPVVAPEDEGRPPTPLRFAWSGEEVGWGVDSEPGLSRKSNL